MDNLKHLEGKTISTIEEDFDGENSYIIIKFKSGEKLNVTAYSSSEEGTGQIDTHVYASNQLVKETLEGKEKNSYLQFGEYLMSKPQYENDDEFDIEDMDDIENDEFDIEDMDDIENDEFDIEDMDDIEDEYEMTDYMKRRMGDFSDDERFEKTGETDYMKRRREMNDEDMDDLPDEYYLNPNKVKRPPEMRPRIK